MSSSEKEKLPYCYTLQNAFVVCCLGVLAQELADLSHRGPYSQYQRISRSSSLCGNDSALPLQHRSSGRQSGNELV